MTPPTVLPSVLDSHGGYTVLTRCGNTLWKPGSTVGDPSGSLVSFDEKSFFQQNNDVTRALYRVGGVRDLVIVWFDNETGLNVCGKEYLASSPGWGRRPDLKL